MIPLKTTEHQNSLKIHLNKLKRALSTIVPKSKQRKELPTKNGTCHLSL